MTRSLRERESHIKNSTFKGEQKNIHKDELNHKTRTNISLDIKKGKSDIQLISPIDHA